MPMPCRIKTLRGPGALDEIGPPFRTKQMQIGFAYDKFLLCIKLSLKIYNLTAGALSPLRKREIGGNKVKVDLRVDLTRTRLG